MVSNGTLIFVLANEPVLNLTRNQPPNLLFANLTADRRWPTAGQMDRCQKFRRSAVSGRPSRIRVVPGKVAILAWNV